MRQFFMSKKSSTPASSTCTAKKTENLSPPKITIKPQNTRSLSRPSPTLGRKIVSLKTKTVELQRTDTHLFHARAKALINNAAREQARASSQRSPNSKEVTTADTPTLSASQPQQKQQPATLKSEANRSPVARNRRDVAALEDAGVRPSATTISGSCASGERTAQCATASGSGTQLSGNYTAKVWQRRSSVRDDSATDTDSEIESLTTSRQLQLQQLPSNQRPALEPLPKKRNNKLSSMARQLRVKGKTSRQRRAEVESANRKRVRKGAGKNGKQRATAGASMNDVKTDEGAQQHQHAGSASSSGGKPGRNARQRMAQKR